MECQKSLHKTKTKITAIKEGAIYYIYKLKGIRFLYISPPRSENFFRHLSIVFFRRDRNKFSDVK